MCPQVENPDLIFQKTGYSQSSTHSINTNYPGWARPSKQNGLSIQRSSNMLPVAPTPSGPVCHQFQQQAICLTSSRSPSMDSGCTQLATGGSGPICLPTGSHLGQSGGEVAALLCSRMILIAPGWPNMPWLWDLVTCPVRFQCACPACPIY